jgi:hypothetical protein
MLNQVYSKFDETTTYKSVSPDSTYSFEIHKSSDSNKRVFLLFPQESFYSGPSSKSVKQLPTTEVLTHEFDNINLIYKFEKPQSVSDQIIDNVRISIIESNCAYLYGKIADDQFDAEMKVWLGSDVEKYIKQNYAFVYPSIDQSKFDFDLYSLKITSSDGSNPFPGQIISNNLTFSNESEENTLFYVICPYFTGENPNVKFELTVTYKEIPPEPETPTPPPTPVLSDCNENETDNECAKGNSDKIEEYLENFEKEEFLENKVEILESSDEEEQKSQNVKVETEGGFVKPTEYNIETKIGKKFNICCILN